MDIAATGPHDAAGGKPNMRNVLLGMVAALAACGGSSGSNLDPALGGTWTGIGTLTLSGGSPQQFDATLTLAVSGQDLTMQRVCLDGSGSVTLHGSGDSASWQGSFPCPPIAFTNCSAVTLTFQSTSVSLSGGTLSANGAGTAAGCGASTGFTVAMTGRK